LLIREPGVSVAALSGNAAEPLALHGVAERFAVNPAPERHLARGRVDAFDFVRLADQRDGAVLIAQLRLRDPLRCPCRQQGAVGTLRAWLRQAVAGLAALVCTTWAGLRRSVVYVVQHLLS